MNNVKNRKLLLGLAAAIAVGIAGAGMYWLGAHNAGNMGAPMAHGIAASPDAEKKPLYWHDPMVPGHRFDKPGKSPFMDMDLVPVYGDDAGDEGTVTISPRVQQNLGVRTAEVKLGSLASDLSAVGSVVYNERDVALVQARSNGFVERLHVRAPLDSIKKGQPLLSMYVPEWIAAQEEYLTARRMQGSGIDGLTGAARQRMRLAGMREEHIRQIESTGKVQARMTVTAPLTGVVTELNAREGMTVTTGAPLFRINGLDTVWVNAEVPESAAARVLPGTPVEARTPALPGTVLKGKVSAILPQVDAGTRTLKARIELPNPARRLVPGMFATLNFAPEAGKQVLLVPSEAVIQTGTRSVVMLAQGDGKFAPVNVEVGSEAQGQTEILSGLSEGQKVVVSGQFLIDSEASLKSAATRMEAAPAAGADKAAPAAKAAAPLHRGEGKVEHIDKDEITLSHGPIPSLKWGPMTMGFVPPAGGLPAGIGVGDTVTFDFLQGKDGTFVITAIAPSAAAPAKPAGAAQ